MCFGEDKETYCYVKLRKLQLPFYNQRTIDEIWKQVWWLPWTNYFEVFINELGDFQIKNNYLIIIGKIKYSNNRANKVFILNNGTLEPIGVITQWSKKLFNDQKTPVEIYKDYQLKIDGLVKKRRRDINQALKLKDR